MRRGFSESKQSPQDWSGGKTKRVKNLPTDVKSATASTLLVHHIQKRDGGTTIELFKVKE